MKRNKPEQQYKKAPRDWSRKKYGPEGYQRLKEKAEKRGIPFNFYRWNDLYDWFKSQPNECYYCRMTPGEYKGLRKKLINYSGDNLFLMKLSKVVNNSSDSCLTIDRADPHYGYNPSNMKLACHICNQSKGAFLNKEQGKVVCPLVIQTIVNELKEEIYSENSW